MKKNKIYCDYYQKRGVIPNRCLLFSFPKPCLKVCSQYKETRIDKKIEK